MITYNPKDWFRLIFQFHKSDTFRILLPTMALLGALTAGLAYVELHHHVVFKSSTVFHQIIGFVLSMLLVFRINTAYDRWWEGRRLWGSLINNTRSLMTKVHAYLDESRPDDVAHLRQLIIGFPFALRDHLRGIAAIEGIPRVEKLDEAAFAQTHNKPLFLYRAIVRTLEAIRRDGALSDEQMLLLNGEVFSLIDITGACERIRSSPIPFSYSLFLKKIIFLYVITMPIAFTLEYGYWAVPAVMVIFYAFASLELVSEEVEEPFGTDANDLPTDDLALKIKGDLTTIV